MGPTKAILTGVLAGCIVACPSERVARADLTGNLRAHVALLASDSLAGRLVGSRGIDEAARYVAEQMRDAGLSAGFDTSYFQAFDVDFGHEVMEGPVLRTGSVELAYRQDFAVLPISGSGEGKAEVVLALDLRGLDSLALTGKTVVCIEPAGLEKERWTLVGHDGVLDWMRDAVADAHRAGARCIIFAGGAPDRQDTGLRTYGVPRTYAAAPIPALEVAYSALSRALGSQGMALDSLVEAARAAVDQTTGLDGLPAEVEVSVGPRSVAAKNVVGLLRGEVEPALWVVVGAHYDHLGYGEIASATPWLRQVHNGADDNASGVAAMIEVARALVSSGRHECSVAFVAFTAEELGALGSEHYCKHPPHSLDKTLAMINLDTVGRLDEMRLIVFGAKSAEEFGELLGEVNQRHGLDLVEKQEIFGFSDQNPFYARGIPSIHFFTGANDDYHSPDDDWQKINFDGLATLTSFVGDFVSSLASAGRDITPVIAEKQNTASRPARGRGAFLGVVPDFAYAGQGVAIRGTMPKSPAEAAGLQTGDVILGIDGAAIADLQGLMGVLSSRGPGDVITLEIVRGSDRLAKRATLGVRSPTQ